MALRAQEFLSLSNLVQYVASLGDNKDWILIQQKHDIDAWIASHLSNAQIMTRLLHIINSLKTTTTKITNMVMTSAEILSTLKLIDDREKKKVLPHNKLVVLRLKSLDLLILYWLIHFYKWVNKFDHSLNSMIRTDSTHRSDHSLDLKAAKSLLIFYNHKWPHRHIFTIHSQLQKKKLLP